MKRIALVACTALIALAACSRQESDRQEMIVPVNFSHVAVDDPFWNPILKRHKEATIPACIAQIEKSERMHNFERASAHVGVHKGIYFDDSDVYKALEGMAYSLKTSPDSLLEQKCDEWIRKIAAAQEPDGYLNTYYSLMGLDKRWTDMKYHEMYCIGHLIEAAVAYYDATGKDKLIEVVCKAADHMMDVFGPGKRDWVPGHEEIELALVKLADHTGDARYLEFADWLLSERGHGHGFSLDEEGALVWDAKYFQDNKPVAQMDSIAGHAVRAMYLYCGMADISSHTGDMTYVDALDRLWDDVINRHMYITGGIGSSRLNEGFTEDYDLPNLTAYCETCASVGMVLWNIRMNQFRGDSRYVDVMERSLYNGALAGMSLSGDRFFYVNPLESEGGHHRKEWYSCACCPSQLCRFLPSIGSYVYGQTEGSLWVNLFISGEASIMSRGREYKVTQTTGYPWFGEVTLSISGKRRFRDDIRIRIPGWCESWTIRVNGKEKTPVMDRGYAVLSGSWSGKDVITLNMDMPARMVAADPRVKEDEGKRAVQRGPLVYCVEEVDNADCYDEIALSESTWFDARYDSDLLGGVVRLSAHDGDKTFGLVPYYSWDNREAGRMKVWIDLR